MNTLKNYILNYVLLILPALLVGGLLAYAGDPSDGLKLFFLSLFGSGLIYLSLSRRFFAIFSML